jgi:hypothetical protein
VEARESYLKMYKAYCAHPSPTYPVACSGLIALPLPLPVPYPYPYPYNQVACSDDSLEKVYRSQEVYERCVASGSRAVDSVPCVSPVRACTARWNPAHA